MRLAHSFKYRFDRLCYAIQGGIGYLRLQLVQKSTMQSLALVMVGRNDDYMPDFAERVRIAIEWNLRHLVEEVIFVEWNPPEGRPWLSIELARRFPGVRCFVVPATIHEEVARNPSLPLMEYHAKNVGIRRARTEWVIAGNADVAVAPDAILAVRRGRIEEGVAYTAERMDIEWEEGRREGVGWWDCLRYKRRIEWTRHGTGDFLMASRRAWEVARGYDESLVRHRIGCDRRGAAQLEAHGLQLQRLGRILHMAHPTSCTEGVRPHHGELATIEGVPYRNGESWGLADCREVEVAERVWVVEQL
jgi:hypothetical protein